MCEIDIPSPLISFERGHWSSVTVVYLIRDLTATAYIYPWISRSRNSNGFGWNILIAQNQGFGVVKKLHRF